MVVHHLRFIEKGYYYIMLKKKVIALNIKINALQIYDSMQSKRENYLSYIFSV